MKFILCLLFLWGCQEKVVFTSEVAKITTQMSENVYEERGLCLKYIRVGHTMIIYDWMIPKTFGTTQNSIVSYPCPRKYQITWHTHSAMAIISPSVQKYYKESTGDPLKTADQMLYLSKRDIQYAKMLSPRYMMVQVSGGVYAWWHISQIEDKDILLPVNNQSKK